MKQTIVCIFILVIFSGLFGCKSSVTDSDNSIKPSVLDTLDRYVTSGVKFSLIGLKDVYTSDDRLTGKIVITNISDTSVFKVNFPIWPAWGLEIYDENMNFVGGGPEGVSFVDVIYQLHPGESYEYDVYWTKTTYCKVKYGVSFPAFAGRYLMKFRLSGNANFYEKYLTKWITISETGKQDPIVFQNTYDQWDVAILDLALRNRFSNDISYTFKNQAIATLTIVDYPGEQDTVYQKEIMFSANTFIVPGKKDTLLFSYHLNKRDSTLINLDGTYKILMKLPLMELDTTFTVFSQFAKGNLTPTTWQN